MLKHHIRTYQSRKERAVTHFENGNRSKPTYSIFEYIKDVINRRHW